MVRSDKEIFVAYYRVSTKKQDLGLDAQKTMVKNYLKNLWLPVESFEEKESGKSDRNRPELKKALDFCKKNKATLVVATLSRLSRDLHFITSLQKAKIDFKVTDMPEASPLTIQIMRAIAEYERKTIGERTSRALQELKKKGKKLGSNNPVVLSGLKSFWASKKEAKGVNGTVKRQARKPGKKNKKPKTQRQIADEKVLGTIRILRKQRMTHKEIAENLNEAGISTRQGGLWHITSVRRVAVRNNIR